MQTTALPDALKPALLPGFGIVQRRVVWAIALAACLIRLFFWSYTGRTWEDALISVLHSENAASGLGLTHHHPGLPPLHGFTSPLSVLIPLAADLVHVGWGILFLKLVSALIAIPTILLAASIAGHRIFHLNLWLVYLLCGYLAFEHHQILWGMAGMETQVVVFVLFLTLYTALEENFTALGISMALCLYARPDLALFLIPVVLYIFVTKRSALLRTLAIAGAVYAPWLIFTTLYYGSPVPHTIIAKSLGYTLWTSHTALFSHNFWSNTWELVHDHIFLPLGPSFAGHGGGFLKFADGGLISRICTAMILLGTLAMAFRFRKFYIIPLGSLVVYSIYYVYFVPTIFGWYLVPFSAINCLLLVLALGALFDTLLPPAWIPALSGVLCVAYVLSFIAIVPVTFKAEKDIQEYVENPVRKSIGQYIFAHKKSGETVGSESLGYVAYYSRLPVYDYPGLASSEVTDLLKAHPGSLDRILEAFKPDWIVLRRNEWEGFYGSLPMNANFMETSYQLAKVFQSDPQHTPGIFHFEANVDLCFYLFKKRPRGDEIAEVAFTRPGPALTGGAVAIKGAWTPDGYHPDAGRAPVDGAVYGSWSGSDANVGSLRLGPYRIRQPAAIAIPLVTGPDSGGLSVQVLNTKTGKPIASLSPLPRHDKWWSWNVALPPEPEAGIEIVAEDAGSAWGQWLAIGVPHSVVYQVGAELTGGPVAIQGSWTRDGYAPDAGRPLVDGTIYGTWSGSDAHAGSLRLGPFHIGQQTSIAIPLVTGRNPAGNAGLSVKVLNAKTGKLIGYLDPPPLRNDWWAWKVAMPPEPDATIEIVAEDSGSGLGEWLAIGLPRSLDTSSALAPAPIPALIPPAVRSDSTLLSPGLAVNHGFCSNGVYGDTRWPGGRRPDGLSTWGSFCSNGNDDVGRLESQEFLAPSALNLYLAGYPGLPGRRLILKNLQSGEETDLRPHATPAEEWQPNNLPLPPEWIGKPVRLIAEDRATGPSGWFGFSLPLLPAPSLLPLIDTHAPHTGFCPNGVYSTTQWPANGRPPGIATWGSFCKNGDADMGWAASRPVIAGSYIHVYIAGYPGTPGIRLAVENVQSGLQVLLAAPASPREMWQLYHFRLPAEWKGQSIRILAGDQASGPGGWIGFSEPVPADLKAEASSAVKLLGLVLFLALLLLIPSVAACTLAALYGVEDLLDLTATAFLAIGFTGYAAFWIYFCSSVLGMLFSYAGWLACCGFIVYVSLSPGRRSRLWPLRQLIAPGALVVLAGIFILSLGLLHGGEASPLSLAAGRFGPPVLAGDNEIPKLFADGLYAGKIPKPIMADWLSSDRPPLQAGNTIWTYPWTSGNRNLSYLALSVILQCSFLAALWSFLIACKIDRRPLALALAACFLSGFTLVNGFFTWPKLFPVAFLLILAAYLLTGRYQPVRDRTAIGAMLGAIAAFAMLCHGGSMFAILGIAACMLLMRRFPSRRFLTGMAVTAVLLYLPWTLYQKLYEPPGDRLLKWHLAGTEHPGPHETFSHLLFGNYGKLTSGELIQLKASNFKLVGGNIPQYLREIGVFSSTLSPDAAGFLRRATILYWIPSIGLAILGPLALLLLSLSRRWRPNSAEFIAASRIWLLTGLTLALWCLLMFGPGATFPHQGTYLTEILALAGSCLAFWAVRPWLAVAATTVQVVWNTALFVWLTPIPPPPGAGSDLGPVNSVLGALCLISAIAICALLAGFALRPARTPAAALSGQPLQVPELPLSFHRMLDFRFMPHSPLPRVRAFRPATLLTVLAVALALWILLSTINIVRFGWVAIPVGDDWDRWITYVTDHYSPSWFFREHVDHRLVVAKVLFAVDHLVFHARGWFLLVCAFGLQALTGFLLWRLSGSAYRQDRAERILLAAVIASCIFSIQQWMNFVFPFQVQFPLVYCFAAAALFALSKSITISSAVGRTPSSASDLPAASWLTGSIALATLATYSMANGILIWPVMLLAAVWLRMPRRWVLAIAASGLFIAVSYFYNWHEFVVPGPMSASERLPRALVFWFGHLGSPVIALALLRDSETFRIACAAIPGALLLVALLAGFVLLWRRREQYNSAQAMLVFYCLFLAASSAMIAYGRSGGTLLEIYAPRYLTPSYLFWVSMLLAAWPLLRRAPRVPLYGALCAAMLVGIAIHQRAMLIALHERVYMEHLGEAAVVDNVTDPEAWYWLYHTPRIALDAIDYLKKERLTIFTEEWSHWPGIPLNRRFTIDRTPGACQGVFEEALPVPSPLRPGWRTTGWAWDNHAGESPRYIVLADDAGLIAGIALAGFPSERYVASTWKGYVNGQPRRITAYAVEADERSLCALGTRDLHPAGTEVTFKELGPRLPDSPPEITGAWVPDGYYKGLGGPGASPVDGRVFGSFPDAGTGSIRLGPFHLDSRTGIAIPMVTGPDTHNLSVVVRDAVTKEVLAQINPPPTRTAWWAWHPDLPPGREITVEVFAEDKGSGWGQWLALGWPHALQH